MTRFLLLFLTAIQLAASEAAPAVSAEEALARLIEGNRRFASGEAVRPHQTPARRAELAQGQAPFAIVLTCSDSRVAPELYFDQGLGDLFVIRNAGNVLDDHVLGSIEYAVEHLHAALIVVVGHEKCGAVSAAVAGGEVPGHVASVVTALQPAVTATRATAGDKVDATVRAHARLIADELARAQPLLAAAVAHGAVKVVAARYELASGRVEFLSPSIPVHEESHHQP